MVGIALITLMAFSTVLMFGMLYVVHYRRKTGLYSVIKAVNEREFMNRFKDAIIDKHCEKARIFKGRCPTNEGEFYSFFHHLFLPINTIQQERIVSVGSKAIKISIILDVILLALILPLIVFFRDAMELIDIILMIVGASIMIVSIPSLFYLISSFWAAELRFYGEIDERFASFYDSPPPQYRIPLASLVEELDRKTADFGKKLTDFDDRGEGIKPKPWAQTVDEMFPQRGRNIDGNDHRS